MKRLLILFLIAVCFGLIGTYLFMSGSDMTQGEPAIQSLEKSVPNLAQAVELVARYDEDTTFWENLWLPTDIIEAFSEYKPDQPWQINTILESGRFTVGYFSSRAEASQRLFNETMGVAPEVEVADGNVWTITIRGHVQAQLVGGLHDNNTVYDGITYQISARSGQLLGIRTGLPTE